MTAASRRIYRAYGFLFALSGFSGLIYETVWARFLKLFLGHAAHAQAAVLALFMGGMAIGAWAGARLSPGRKNPLLFYAAVEGVIGLGALVFPGAFDAAIGWAFATVIPGLASPLAVAAFKWLLSAVLLLPQSILLGATFHLMAAGLIRAWPETPSRTIASLYFLNSLGAAAGAIVSGFWLVGWLGLPGTVRLAGGINLFLAAAVFLLAGPSTATRETGCPDGTGRPADRRFREFLAVAMLTGAASFLYEIGWIRMLSLVLGSSTHAFELMLSAFILGLALGAAWISGRIEGLASPGRFLGYVQVGMGLCALATLPVYALTFDIMRAGVRLLPPTGGGYALFNILSHGIALLVMLPATFCAGAVLPLVTATLLREGYGERSIGQVYTWNTLGAVAGVFLGVHVGFPLLGLKGILGAGAFLDIAVGAWLLRATRRPGERGLRFAAAAAIALLLPLAAVAWLPLDARKMVSGVYRNGELFTDPAGRILFNADGKTATASVVLTGTGTLTLLTNGKPDASIQPDGEHTVDEATMTLLGVLPVSMKPDARSAANIGLGCGLTTHSLLLSPKLLSVDTIEIEPEMVRAAKWFQPAAEKTFTDPRSTLRIDDARNFFSGSRRRYDIIVSEPSNPWVSGVSDLFTVEFYRQVRRTLSDDGIFVQWMHLYELDPALLASVLKAIALNFDDFAVYATNDFDILIAARNGRSIPVPDPAYLRTLPVAKALERISIRGPGDIAIRKIASRRTLSGFLERHPVPPNSDYRPVLGEGSPRARFMKTLFWEFAGHSYAPLPAYQFLSGEFRRGERTEITPSADFQATVFASRAAILRDLYLSGNPGGKIGALPEPLAGDAVTVGRMFFGPGGGMDEAQRFGALYNVGSLLTCFLSTDELAAVWKRLESGGAFAAMTDREKCWVAFQKAVGQREGREIIRSAETFLMRHAGRHPMADQYVVLAAALGAAATGDAGERSRTAPLLRDDRIVRDPEARFLRSVIGP